MKCTATGAQQTVAQLTQQFESQDAQAQNSAQQSKVKKLAGMFEQAAQAGIKSAAQSAQFSQQAACDSFEPSAQSSQRKG